MQNLLYGKTKKTVETYEYHINSGGELNINERGKITIVFEDGKFKHVLFPFASAYSRNAWKILAAIDKEIEEIEAA